MYDLIIKGNNILTPDGLQQAAVLVKDGRIHAIQTDLPDNASSIVDIGDKVLMPGITDPHVHINEPGRTDWEGFDTATRAAIAGGITTLVDMPLNSSPVTTTVQALEQKLSAAAAQLHADCGFWGGVIPGNENEIEPLINKGVQGFKAFLTHSGIDEFPNVTAADLEKVMPIIARYDLPLLVHCELMEEGQPAFAQDNKRSHRQYMASRPQTWEQAAIDLMIRLCEKHRCRVHIVHLSAADAIENIIAAKEKGLPITVETAQHYLYFNGEEVPDGNTSFKCAPPIRERENNQQLWEALKAGVIDFVATDHSPSPPELKELESGDFTTAWGGISSLQLALPALWTAGRSRDVTLPQIARWLCEQPAILAGVQNRKGKIAAGYDADFVVWDPDRLFTVHAETLFHKHKLTPYVNETLYGVVEQTYIRGVKVFDQGNFTSLYQGKTILRGKG
ncbi:allantoinase AllB [Chitinophaga filiformis]|uniref:allantoinase AllB n=1 Tax=Chitinophaga filiformis TaxID=104663 RepID=UPI001F48580F|nr:allantoinase AllB [Chitinophaga filiformis]MCF6403755.1 allantoinase AllB [Chitinophaga filiformis]